MVVDEHVVELARVLVDFRCPDGIAVDAIVEHPVLEVEGGLLARHAVEEGPELEVGHRPGVVGEEQGAHGHQHHGE